MNGVMENDEGPAEEMVLGTIIIELILTEAGTFPRCTFDDHMESWQGLGALHFALLQLTNHITEAISERRYELQQMEEEENDEQ